MYNHEQLERYLVKQDDEISHIYVNNRGKNKAPNSANKLVDRRKIVFFPLEDCVELAQIKHEAHQCAILFDCAKRWRYVVAVLYFFRRELT